MNLKRIAARLLLKATNYRSLSFIWRRHFMGERGYETKEIIESVIKKNLEFRKSGINQELSFENSKILTAVGIVTQMPREKQPIKVLDFGGGGGHCYWVARRFFPEIQFEWHVVETEELCSAANLRLAREGLRFYKDLAELPDTNVVYDLIFANSSIQYTKEPFETLKKILEIGTSLLFITRTPLAYGQTDYEYSQFSIASENGPGYITDTNPKVVSYECKALSKTSLIYEVKKFFAVVDVLYEGTWDGKTRKVGTYSIIGRTP